ncbi:hypothetical protein Sjap_002240 [Stephania japonica]|uniref:Uncharacterized protein n=1 Tax=Stephania japonica TaxID=461633 RepID=A0AAP0KMG0_9MAGN
MNSPIFGSPSPTTPLLSATSTTTTTTSGSNSEDDYDNDNIPVIDSTQIPFQDSKFRLPGSQLCEHSHKSLAVLSGHVGSVSCLALCGEFILSASQGKDIIVWQQPDLRKFAKFGQGDGSVKALVTIGNKVFTAHQDSRIRVWKVSRSSENVFRLVATMPTRKDYLGKFMKQSNYVQTRRHHKHLWIEHADSISCLAVSSKGFIYSGSWDKTLKVWRVSDLKCLESIRAHDDAINGLVENKGLVYSASADGKIKVWWKKNSSEHDSSVHSLKGVLEGHKDVSLNSVVVCPDGEMVYGGGSDGYVMVWEGKNKGVDSWKLVGEVRAHKMAVLCLSLVGEFVFSGSADKSIGVWRRDGVGLVSVGILRGHEGPVKCLQASPSSVGGGFLVYSGGLDRSLRVWWVPKEKSTKNT